MPSCVSALVTTAQMYDFVCLGAFALTLSLPPRGEAHNNTASLAALFEKNTLHNLRSLALYTIAKTHVITHHLENAPRFAEYAYVGTPPPVTILEGGTR